MLQFSDDQLHAKACELGLITVDESLPRQLRSRVVAALVATTTAPAAATDPQLAQDITVRGAEVLIDGEPFPWLIAATPMDIVLSPDGPSTVRLTLMAATVQVIKPEPRPESE